MKLILCSCKDISELNDALVFFFLFVFDKIKSSQYDSCTKRCAESVATSLKIPDRRIGRADGQDCANLGHFAKKPSSFIEINPQSTKLCIFSTKLLEPN